MKGNDLLVGNAGTAENIQTAAHRYIKPVLPRLLYQFQVGKAAHPAGTDPARGSAP